MLFLYVLMFFLSNLSRNENASLRGRFSSINCLDLSPLLDTIAISERRRNAFVEFSFTLKVATLLVNESTSGPGRPHELQVLPKNAQKI